MVESDIIKKFFISPEQYIEGELIYSKLQLIQRDVLTCLGFCPNTRNRINYIAIFPAIITIFSGIDLLSKLYHGENTYDKSGDKFRSFLRNSNLLKEHEINLIYKLRNSVVHSYSLQSIKVKNNMIIEKYNFRLVKKDDCKLFEEVSKNLFEISLNGLHNLFESSIIFLHMQVKDNQAIKNNFNKIIQNFGFIQII